MRRVERGGVVLHELRDGPVRAAFTERTGGVSRPPYESLNLGSHVGDDPSAVRENRRRALAALGCEEQIARLIVPNQVHGDRVAVVGSASDSELERVRVEASLGADAVVCTVSAVPVLLCFADCVPVILTAPHGFAVVHSGWRGTLCRIAAKAAAVLADAAGAGGDEISAYLGPHILGDEYEVSDELAARFEAEFGWRGGRGRGLDLSRAIRQALVEAGVPAARIEDPRLSTVRSNDRFFSFRAEGGTCCRHAALAVMTEA